MTLDDFLCGKNVNEFFNEKWGIDFCYFTKSLFSLERPEELLVSLLELPRLRYPQVRILNGGGALNPSLYTASSRYGLSEVILNEKVLALAVAPNTIKIEDLASLDSVFARWASLLGRLFSSKITINGYFSFGPSDGIPAHYDPHHIFAIQLYGEKTWSFGVSQSEYFPHAALTLSNDLKPEMTDGHQLKAGEMLYVPPGRLHSVRTAQHSVHLAVGIHTPRCFQNVSDLLAKAVARHPELREDMPFTISSEGLQFLPLSVTELESAFRLIMAEHDSFGNMR